ncbi:MAG: hypothetical protein AAGC55_04395, partial [Myxococcota bacterium]
RKEPAERYQSVDALAADLALFGEGGRYARRAAVEVGAAGKEPKPLNVPSVLQQRTAMSFESMKIALGSTIMPEQLIAGAGPTVRESGGKSKTFIAAIAGMIVGACLIAGAIYLFGGSSSVASPQAGAAELLPDDAPAEQLPGPAAPKADHERAEQAEGVAAAGDSADEQSDDLSEAAGDTDEGKDVRRAVASDDKRDNDRASKRRDRKERNRSDRGSSRRSKQKDKPDTGPPRGTSPKTVRPPPDPFGTMH